MSHILNPAPPAAVRDRTLARLSFAFLLDETSQGVAGLKPLDALLVLAINQANIAPLTRDPAARERYGQLEAPAPDNERRPASINAIAASLGAPFETVRRRVRGLAAAGVCTIAPEGVVIPATFLASPAYLRSVMEAHERLRRFYFELKAAGLTGDLPPSAFETGDAVPVRAAARLISDYVLRASEGLLRETGNVISLLPFVALLSAALDADGAPRPLMVSGLARRLGLPPETVRRHAAQLTEDELCRAVQGGLVMTPEILERPGLKLLVAENITNVQRLMSGLAERGVIAAWEVST